MRTFFYLIGCTCYTRNETAKDRYQKVQCYIHWLDIKFGDLLHSRVVARKPSEKAIMQIRTLDRVHSLCVLKEQRRACIDSRKLSTTFAQPVKITFLMLFYLIGCTCYTQLDALVIRATRQQKIDTKRFSATLA
jgi:hypothetical protein